MAITWRTDYAMRLIYELARARPQRRATVRQLSEAAGIPYDYARGIAASLVSAGLLKSRRGVHGGVELARPASAISLLDVFRAMDEPASLALCTGEMAVCEREGSCPYHQVVWNVLDARIESYLGETTLESVVETGLRLGDPQRPLGARR